MIYPSFKNDQKYYTPAFVNPYSEVKVGFKVEFGQGTGTPM